MKLFGISTEENLPAIYFNSHKAWDSYMAHIWYNFLYFLNLHDNDIIVEVGPGTSIKIALALAKLQFKGKIYLIDPYREALTHVEKLYQQYLPEAEIHIIDKKLNDCLDLIPKPKFIVSNHPLDDMILAGGLTNNNLADLFHWVSVDAESLFPISQQTWKELESKPRKLINLKKNIFDEWCHAIKILNPDIYIMSQYESSTLNNYGMQLLNQHAKELFSSLKKTFSNLLLNAETIQALLNSNKNFNDKHIGTEVLNANNWLVYRKEHA